MSPLDQAIHDAQLLAAEFGCEARPCVRRDAPPGVEAILDGGRVRLSGDVAEVRAELRELRDKTTAEMTVSAGVSPPELALMRQTSARVNLAS